MQLLLIVLNKIEKLNAMLDSLMEAGIGGATILKSKGMVKVLAKNIEQYPILGSLRHLLDDNEDRRESKTIFMVLPDNKVEAAKQIVRDTIGDLSKPDTAIMITVPVLSVEGVEIK